jgi:hypothetical protein
MKGVQICKNSRSGRCLPPTPREFARFSRVWRLRASRTSNMASKPDNSKKSQVRVSPRPLATPAADDPLACAGRAASTGQVLPKKEGAQRGPAQRDPGLVRPVRQGRDGYHRHGGPLGRHARAGLRAQEGTAARLEKRMAQPAGPSGARRAWMVPARGAVADAVRGSGCGQLATEAPVGQAMPRSAATS